MTHKIPVLPGNVGGVTTPMTAEQLNAMALWKTPAPADLKSIVTTDFGSYNNDAQLLFYTSGGVYRWNAAQTYPEDGDLVINSDYTGQYLLALSNGDMAGVYLSKDIQEVLPVVSTDLDFGTVSAQSISSAETVTVPGARVGDFVQVQTGELPSGVFVHTAHVTDKNEVTIKLFNSDNTSWNPASMSFSILVTAQNTVPNIRARGYQFYFDLQDPDNYTEVELEADLATDENKAQFEKLLDSRKRRQEFLDNSSIKTVIQNSVTANELMERIEGAGY